MDSAPQKLPKEESKGPAKSTGFVLKPKKPTSAWIYFNTEMVAKLKAEKSLEQKDAFTKSAEIWKGMSDAEKEPYAARSKGDEERYKKQLRELETNGFFLTEDGVKSTDLKVDPKKKFGADVILPKKPLSAYLFYTTENVNKIKDEQSCTHTEAMKKCGELWNSLEPEKKAKYEGQHNNDVTRYNN